MDRKREDLLERVKGKKYQWETRSMCRTLLVGMMDKAVESSDEKHGYSGRFSLVPGDSQVRTAG